MTNVFSVLLVFYHRQKYRVGFFDKKLDLKKAGLSEDKCCLKTSLDKLNTTILMRFSFHFLAIVVIRFFFNFWAKIRKTHKSYPYRMCGMAKASTY